MHTKEEKKKRTQRREKRWEKNRV